MPSLPCPGADRLGCTCHPPPSPLSSLASRSAAGASVSGVRITSVASITARGCLLFDMHTLHTLHTTRNITSRHARFNQSRTSRAQSWQSEGALAFAAKCKSATSGTSGTRSPIRARPNIGETLRAASGAALLWGGGSFHVIPTQASSSLGVGTMLQYLLLVPRNQCNEGREMAQQARTGARVWCGNSGAAVYPKHLVAEVSSREGRPRTRTAV
jgi:hypothetical protein